MHITNFHGKLGQNYYNRYFITQFLEKDYASLR